MTDRWTVLSVDDPADMKTWTTFWVKIWKGERVDLHGPEALAYMQANTDGLCDPFKSAIEWSPEDSACDIDEMKYWEAEPWDNRQGRVTLLGDAAHPMLICRSCLALRYPTLSAAKLVGSSWSGPTARHH